MKTRTIITSLAVLAAVIGTAGFAQAYHGHRGYGNGYGYGDSYGDGYGYGDGHRGYHRFGNCPYADGSGYGHYAYQGKQLTEEEAAKLNDMRNKHFESMEPLWDELRTKRMELNALKHNPNVKAETLSKLVREINDLENKVDDERQAFRTQVEKEFGIEYYGGFGRNGGHGKMGRMGGYGCSR